MIPGSETQALHGSRLDTRFRAQAALLIYMYKDEPILQWPYQLIQSLCEVDEMMGNFRHRHAQMVLIFCVRMSCP